MNEAVNFETMSLEDLAKFLKDGAGHLEKKIKQSHAQAKQMQKLAGTILGIKETEAETKPEAVAAKETASNEPAFYRHPDNASLVWEGPKGRKPQWLRDLLRKEGWKLEDLRVPAEEVKPEEAKEEAAPVEAVEAAEEEKPEEKKEPIPAVPYGSNWGR